MSLLAQGGRPLSFPQHPLALLRLRLARQPLPQRLARGRRQPMPQTWSQRRSGLPLPRLRGWRIFFIKCNWAGIASE